jgi:hypothetical protein
MSTYTLTNTAKEIDDAVQAVTGADNAPQPNSDLMVTSGGVHTAVNNINLTNMASGVITTEADGISNFDTDGNIPTNAAVKDYVDGQTFGIVNVVFSGTARYSNWDATVQYSNLTTVDNGTTITVPTGNYVYLVSGDIPDVSYRIEFLLNGGIRIALGSGWSDGRTLSPLSGFITNMSSVYLYGQTQGANVTLYKPISVTFFKVS